jgi:HAD superfamily hydrolase (TIGR01549 family)
MARQAVTFDFHNTLAACPEWFELEVRRLPSAFLQWRASFTSLPVDPELSAEADVRYRQLRHEIMDHGEELTAEASLNQVFAALQIDILQSEVAHGVETLMREALAGATPVPGAVETVREIADAGVPIGIVSSAVYHPFLEWTLASFGILEAFDVIVTSASAGFYKSRPEIYEHAAVALGAPPPRMVHVGDSLRFDVGGASRAGMGTVWLQRDGADAGELDLTPDLIIRTLEGAGQEILGLLRARQIDHDGAES